MSDKKKELETNKFNRLNPTVISNHIYFETRKRFKLSLNRLVMMTDIDNRIPLHLACLYNNIDIIKSLIDINSSLELRDNSNKVKKILKYLFFIFTETN